MKDGSGVTIGVSHPRCNIKHGGRSSAWLERVVVATRPGVRISSVTLKGYVPVSVAYRRKARRSRLPLSVVGAEEVPWSEGGFPRSCKAV